LLSRRLGRIEDSMEKLQKEVSRQLGRLAHLPKPQAGSAPGFGEAVSTPELGKVAEPSVCANPQKPRGLALYRLMLHASLLKLKAVRTVASTVSKRYSGLKANSRSSGAASSRIPSIACVVESCGQQPPMILSLYRSRRVHGIKTRCRPSLSGHLITRHPTTPSRQNWQCPGPINLHSAERPVPC
jgi:hypothetical protein